MNLIIKSSDDSYFYLFKILSNKYKYLDVVPSGNINNLVFSKIDSLGYIKDTKINLEEILKNRIVNKVFIEEETILSTKLFNKYKVKYYVFNKNTYYVNEINKLRSTILLKYILEENKDSIYKLSVLILGENNQTNHIKTLLSSITSYDTYNKDITNMTLNKYDIIISTSNLEINPEMLFNVKKNLIIYDLEPFNSKIDKNILLNNYIKYRYINNVSLYLPIAKANILNEVMCEHESL